MRHDNPSSSAPGPALLRRLGCTFMLLAVTGCASPGARTPGDPLEPMNRAVYKFNDVADRYVAKPVARTYDTLVPEFIRTGVRNFFNNVDDVFVVANDLLQGKMTQASQDSVRLVSNTIFGGLGLVDVASKRGLYKNNEDFGQTLGRWGVGGGPFLMLPVLGPSNFRDLGGYAVYTQADLVWRVNDVPSRYTLVGLRAVDTRASLLRVERVLDEAAVDRYSFLRDAYLQRRLNLIYDGNPPRSRTQLDDPDDLEDPGEGSADDPK